MITAVLLLTGCDLLLGPAPASDSIRNLRWENEIVATGAVAGLDAAVSADGELVVSYIHEDSRLRISQHSGAGWKEYDGPTVAFAPGTATTHLAVGSNGEIAVLFWTGSDMEIATYGPDGERHLALLTLEAEEYGGARPTAWDPTAADLDFTSDDLLRAVVQEEVTGGLWLFLERSDRWILRPVAASDGVNNAIDMTVSPDDEVDLVFQAAGQGLYYRWQEGEGWIERLQIPNSLPYRLRLRDDGTSVLATRLLNRIYVAEEIWDEMDGAAKWYSRRVIEHEDLYWKKLDLVLDGNGYPGVMHLLGPYRDRYFEVWYSQLEADGTWSRAQVAGNLDIQNAFDPFDITMVRDPEDWIHILFVSGGATAAGSNQTTVVPQLLHLSSDGSALHSASGR